MSYSDSDQLRKFANLLVESAQIKEEVSVQMVNGKWTDGTYTDGDAITYHGLGWNLEFEPSQKATDPSSPVNGTWYAINNDGEEIEFDPGMEDRHDPAHRSAPQAFPEDIELDEANPDGTIGDDEDERLDTFLMHAETAGHDYADRFANDAYDIGGNFRGPGYLKQAKRAFLKAFEDGLHDAAYKLSQEHRDATRHVQDRLRND